MRFLVTIREAWFDNADNDHLVKVFTIDSNYLAMTALKDDLEERLDAYNRQHEREGFALLLTIEEVPVPIEHQTEEGIKEWVNNNTPEPTPVVAVSLDPNLFMTTDQMVNQVFGRPQ